LLILIALMGIALGRHRYGLAQAGTAREGARLAGFVGTSSARNPASTTNVRREATSVSQNRLMIYCLDITLSGDATLLASRLSGPDHRHGVGVRERPRGPDRSASTASLKTRRSSALAFPSDYGDFEGKEHYREWRFVYSVMAPQQAPQQLAAATTATTAAANTAAGTQPQQLHAAGWHRAQTP